MKLHPDAIPAILKKDTLDHFTNSDITASQEDINLLHADHNADAGVDPI